MKYHIHLPCAKITLDRALAAINSSMSWKISVDDAAIVLCTIILNPCIVA